MRFPFFEKKIILLGSKNQHLFFRGSELKTDSGLPSNPSYNVGKIFCSYVFALYRRTNRNCVTPAKGSWFAVYSSKTGSGPETSHARYRCARFHNTFPATNKTKAKMSAPSKMAKKSSPSVVRISSLEVFDLRFPTSLEADGSDALHVDPGEIDEGTRWFVSNKKFQNNLSCFSDYPYCFLMCLAVKGQSVKSIRS